MTADRAHRSSPRPATGLLAVLVTLLLVAAACGSSKRVASSTGDSSAGAGDQHLVDDTGSPKEGGSLVFGLEAETDSFNPVTGRWAMSGHLVGSAIFDALATMDADGKTVPFLAKSFEPNADNTVWTIHLREGVQFQDGEPLDAAAVVRNLQTYKDALITGKSYSMLSAITVVDPLTVQVTSSQPWANLPNVWLGQAGYMVAPKNLDDQHGGEHPIGTGPFTFKDWVPNDHLTVTKNQHYWQQGLPHLDQITFKPIPEPQARLDALTSGTIDTMVTENPDSILAVRANHDLRRIEYKDGEERHIVLNTQAAPFDNLVARQAAAYAIDTARYLDEIGHGVYTPANGMFGPGQLGYTEDSGYPGYDLEKAKALVAEYTKQTGKPFAFTLLGTADVALAKQDQLIKSMWEAAGMQVSLQSINQPDQVVTVVLGKYQASDFRLFGSPDPDVDYVWWASSSVGKPNDVSLDMARYATPETDKALLAGRASSDRATRDKAYQDFERAMNAGVPFLWLARDNWMMASTAKVHGYGAAVNGSISTLGPKTWIANLWLS